MSYGIVSHGEVFMMTRILIALFLLLGITESAFALRCGHRLVSEGDYIEEVRYKCGDPLAIDTYTIYREKRISFPGHVRLIKYKDDTHLIEDGSVRIERGKQIEIVVEEWVYNFGPRRLMRRLRFENGVLRDIEALRYGYLPY